MAHDVIMAAVPGAFLLLVFFTCPEKNFQNYSAKLINLGKSFTSILSLIHRVPVIYVTLYEYFITTTIK